MMDSLLMDTFSPFTFTKITTHHRQKQASRRQHHRAPGPVSAAPMRAQPPPPPPPQQPPGTAIPRESRNPQSAAWIHHVDTPPSLSFTEFMQRPADSAAGARGGHNHTPPVANDKWVASLRRRDPEIQPALPAIGTLRGR